MTQTIFKKEKKKLSLGGQLGIDWKTEKNQELMNYYNTHLKDKTSFSKSEYDKHFENLKKIKGKKLSVKDVQYNTLTSILKQSPIYTDSTTTLQMKNQMSDSLYQSIYGNMPELKPQDIKNYDKKVYKQKLKNDPKTIETRIHTLSKLLDAISDRHGNPKNDRLKSKHEKYTKEIEDLINTLDDLIK